MKAFLVLLLSVGLLASLPLVTQIPFLSNSTLLDPFQEYQPDELEGLAHMAAILHDVNPDIFIAQMRQESRFDQYARSKAGAIGVAQIMPDTAKSWKVDPRAPLQALNAAAKNMAGYVRTYKAQGYDELTAYKLALAAYNAGPGAVAKYKGVPPYPETQQYISAIIPEK